MAEILVQQARGLGDLLAAVPALRALRRSEPGDRLVLAAPARLAPIVALIASVDAMLPVADGSSLRWNGPPPRLALNLHEPGTAGLDALRRTGAERVLTHRDPAHPELDGPRWAEDAHAVDRWCHLLEHAGIPADPRNLGLMPPVSTVDRRGCVAVHIGASAPARRWPPDRFAAVVRHLLEAGREVVVTGDGSERRIAQKVAARAGLPLGNVLAGEQNLVELAATVAEADLVVCGDTGVAALATAFGTRTVLLCGPTPPGRVGPPPHLSARHALLWAGATGDRDGQVPDAGLLRIEIAEVLAAVDGQLAVRHTRGEPAGPRPALYRRVG